MTTRRVSQKKQPTDQPTIIKTAYSHISLFNIIQHLYNHSTGNLSFGIRRGSRYDKIDYYPYLFEGLSKSFTGDPDDQALCMYMASRGRYLAFRLEYLGSLQCLPPMVGTTDSRFQTRSRFEISLVKLARHAISRMRARSLLGKMFEFTDSCDSIRFTRDFFMPSLSNHMTALQARYPSPTDFLLTYPGTMSTEDWLNARLIWSRIRYSNPYTRWKKKNVLRDALRDFYLVRTHNNNVNLLRFLAYGLFNFVKTPGSCCEHALHCACLTDY